MKAEIKINNFQENFLAIQRESWSKVSLGCSISERLGNNEHICNQQRWKHSRGSTRRTNTEQSSFYEGNRESESRHNTTGTVRRKTKVKKRFQSADHIYVKTIIHQIKSQLQNCCDIPREGKAKSPKLVKSPKRKETCNLLLHQLLKRLRLLWKKLTYHNLLLPSFFQSRRGGGSFRGRSGSTWHSRGSFSNSNNNGRAGQPRDWGGTRGVLWNGEGGGKLKDNSY